IMPICKFADLLPQLAGFQGFLGAVRNGITPDKIIPGALPPAWIVGPEGGFTPEEEADLIAGGVTPLRIAKYVLRVESAVNGGIAILNAAFDNIGEKLPDFGEEWD
ncbi:MAG: 16S rRNA (uracil(1498)-N(3))-methyltransferase, partial [Victivallaceae bacterium]